MNVRRLTFFFILICFTSTSFAVQGNPPNRPKVGLALAGGGAKGLAHIGVLKVLEEIGIEADVVSGTSMGSIIGGLYAVGYTASELEEIATSTDWIELFSDQANLSQTSMIQKPQEDRTLFKLGISKSGVQLPSGIIQGREISNLLARLTWHVHDIQNFTQLPRPFVCIATDLENAEPVVLKSGNLAQSIRASMAIPSIFTPVILDDRYLVDGGLTRNFPVSDVRELGADIVIGVDVGSPLKSRDKLQSFVDILNQTMMLKGALYNEEQRELCNTLILPDVSKYSVGDFTRAEELIAIGEKAAREVYPKLVALKEELDQFDSPYYASHPPTVRKILVHQIDIVGNDKVDERVILSEMNLDLPVWLTDKELEDVIAHLYSTQFFRQVSYLLYPSPKGTRLELHVIEDENRYLGFGFHYNNDTDASLLVNASLNNLLRSSSILLAEAIVGQHNSFDLTFYSHFHKRSRLGVRIRQRYEDTNQFVTTASLLTPGNYSYRRVFADLLVGSIFSTNTLAGVGVRSEHSYYRTPRSDGKAVKGEYNMPVVYGLLQLDTFDRNVFPTEGLRFHATMEFSEKWFKYDTEYRYSRLDFRWHNAFTPTVSTFRMLTYGYANYTAPFYKFFDNNPERLFINMSPTHNGFYGRHLLVMGTGIQWEFKPRRFLILRGDYGNVYENSDQTMEEFFERSKWDAGLELGFLTPLGPVSASAATGSFNDVYFFVNMGFQFLKRPIP